MRGRHERDFFDLSGQQAVGQRQAGCHIIGQPGTVTCCVDGGSSIIDTLLRTRWIVRCVHTTALIFYWTIRVIGIHVELVLLKKKKLLL